MNTSERKTLKLMKLVSFGTICLILVALYVLAQKQDNNRSASLVAGTKIELLDNKQILNLKSFPWAIETFSKAITNEKVNYINYWAQWCEPCLSEIPYLINFSKINPNINLIFVNVDNKSNLDSAKNWWKKNGQMAKSYYPKYETNILKHTRGLPYHQIYNKNKDMIAHFTGNIEEKETQIMNLLNKFR